MTTYSKKNSYDCAVKSQSSQKEAKHIGLHEIKTFSDRTLERGGQNLLSEHIGSPRQLKQYPGRIVRVSASLRSVKRI